jgi:eukaryotic-like serine/threonine-protein kinase
MTTAQRIGTPLPVGSTVIPGTLRAHMEEARAEGGALTLRRAVGIIVPLAVEIADRHAAGETLFVHPSSVMADEQGRFHISPELALRAPTLPRDKACLAPEERAGAPGNARASVYAIGAMFYEILTGLSVGPGMRRPTEVVPALPAETEMVLSKALVADPAHRPDDLYALAQAIHHLAPSGSMPPPEADESHLDHGEGFNVDVSLSMMPPAPSVPGHDLPHSPYNVGVRQSTPETRPSSDSTSELAVLKARLERDKRPRYVVIKDGMDHGPFSAVELLQQIATHTFVESDYLRDSFSKDERAIRDWDEFAPFAEHARLHRDIKAEKEALERTVVQERKSTTSKALIGSIVVIALVAGAAAWFITQRGARSDEIAVQGETVTNVETDAVLKASKSAKGGRGKGGVVGTSGGFPILAGGTSCEAAQAAYVEEMTIGGGKGQADLTAGAYQSILGNGAYLNRCGVPENMTVSVCAAVQNGRAVGVSVNTNPRNPGVSSCISSAVRGMSFPAHPKLDVTRTTFAAQ